MKRKARTPDFMAAFSGRRPSVINWAILDDPAAVDDLHRILCSDTPGPHIVPATDDFMEISLL